MNALPDMPQKIHEGRNIKRFREMLGLKQDALAWELGEDWTQQRLSLLEQEETIDSTILEQVSKALKIPVDAIRNFNEEKAINIISSTFNDSAAVYNYQPSFNPIDKLMEVMEENKQLYERLLASEREKIEMLKGKKG